MQKFNVNFPDNPRGYTESEVLELKRQYKRYLDQIKDDLEIKIKRYEVESESLVFEDKANEIMSLQKEMLDLNFAICELILK